MRSDFEEEYSQNEEDEGGFGVYQERVVNSQLNNNRGRGEQQSRMKQMKSMDY